MCEPTNQNNLVRGIVNEELLNEKFNSLTQAWLHLTRADWFSSASPNNKAPLLRNEWQQLDGWVPHWNLDSDCQRKTVYSNDLHTCIIRNFWKHAEQMITQCLEKKGEISYSREGVCSCEYQLQKIDFTSTQHSKKWQVNWVPLTLIYIDVIEQFFEFWRFVVAIQKSNIHSGSCWSLRGSTVRCYHLDGGNELIVLRDKIAFNFPCSFFLFCFQLINE